MSPFPTLLVFYPNHNPTVPTPPTVTLPYLQTTIPPCSAFHSIIVSSYRNPTVINTVPPCSGHKWACPSWVGPPRWPRRTRSDCVRWTRAAAARAAGMKIQIWISCQFNHGICNPVEKKCVSGIGGIQWMDWKILIFMIRTSPLIKINWCIAQISAPNSSRE